MLGISSLQLKLSPMEETYKLPKGAYSGSSKIIPFLDGETRSKVPILVKAMGAGRRAAPGVLPCTCLYAEWWGQIYSQFSGTHHEGCLLGEQCIC